MFFLVRSFFVSLNKNIMMRMRGRKKKLEAGRRRVTYIPFCIQTKKNVHQGQFPSSYLFSVHSKTLELFSNIRPKANTHTYIHLQTSQKEVEFRTNMKNNSDGKTLRERLHLCYCYRDWGSSLRVGKGSSGL